MHVGRGWKRNGRGAQGKGVERGGEEEAEGK